MNLLKLGPEILITVEMPNGDTFSGKAVVKALSMTCSAETDSTEQELELLCTEGVYAKKQEPDYTDLNKYSPGRLLWEEWQEFEKWACINRRSVYGEYWAAINYMDDDYWCSFDDWCERSQPNILSEWLQIQAEGSQ